MQLRRHSNTREETISSRAERRQRRLWIAADVVAVTVIGSGLWWRWLNVVPSVNIPAPPPLPSPNAFDTFTRAGSLLKEKAVIDNASSKPDQLPSDRKGVPYSDAEKAAAISANAETLSTLRSGFSQEYQNPSRRSFDALFPELAKFRGMARLLSLEGQVREAKGDFAGAAQSRIDAVQLGAEIPRGGVLINYLVGAACEAIGKRPLWSLADKLSADEARPAAKRLETINAQRVPLADALIEEKWFTEQSLLTQFQKATTLQMFRQMVGQWESDSPDSQNTPQMVPLLLPLLTKSKTQIIADHNAFADRIIARARLSYPAASRVVLPPVPNDPINMVLWPVFEGVRIKEADMQMQSSLIIAVFALQAYKVEHGVYPEDLTALVSGGYLTRIPADPFSETGTAPLQYRRLEDGKYLLYSIGPDCKDDAGTPIPATFASGKSKTWVEADMKGDFVVGVNNLRTEKSPGS